MAFVDMQDEVVGYISFYCSLNEEHPIPEGEPRFNGRHWTWGRYGTTRNERCCRCGIRESLRVLMRNSEPRVYYITRWQGRRYLTGRIVWGDPKQGTCDRAYSSRGWCWAYRSKNVKFIRPYPFDGRLFCSLYGENHDKSQKIRVKKVDASQASILDKIFRRRTDLTSLYESLYVKISSRRKCSVADSYGTHVG